MRIMEKEIVMEMMIYNREGRMNVQPGSLGCQTF